MEWQGKKGIFNFAINGDQVMLKFTNRTVEVLGGESNLDSLINSQKLKVNDPIGILKSVQFLRITDTEFMVFVSPIRVSGSFYDRFDMQPD